MMGSGLVLYAGWDAFGVPDMSPFGLKVRTYLRMIGVPYSVKLGDPRTAPTKKIPYIDDGGTIVGDSGLIFDHLKKKHGDALDAKLTKEEHALGHLVRRTLEESAYFTVLYTRWVEDEHWPEIRKLMLPLMPPVIGGMIVDGPIRGGVKKQAFAQGTGRHAREHIHALGCADVDAIATFLGDKPFILGSAPTSYDASVYAFIANGIAYPPTSPIAKRAKGHANLVAYCERMTAKYWATPDAKTSR
jgi:glutathione S-transferase